jgi:hypothetical protein
MLKLLSYILLLNQFFISQIWFVDALEISQIKSSDINWINISVDKFEDNEKNTLDIKNRQQKNGIKIRIGKKINRFLSGNYSKNVSLFNPSKYNSIRITENNGKNYNYSWNSFYPKNTYHLLFWIIKNIN